MIFLNKLKVGTAYALSQVSTDNPSLPIPKQAKPGATDMTKTTSTLTASALALIANTAGAFDFYGNFANQDTVPDIHSQGAPTLSRSDSMATTRTSLDVVTAGSPDSAGQPAPGYVQVIDSTAPRITSLDRLTAGNPDSAVHPVPGYDSPRPAAMATSQTKQGDGSV
jgi:hypothetical protein